MADSAYLHNHFHHTVQDMADPNASLRLVCQQHVIRQLEMISVFQDIAYHF